MLAVKSRKKNEVGEKQLVEERERRKKEERKKSIKVMARFRFHGREAFIAKKTVKVGIVPTRLTPPSPKILKMLTKF